MISKKHRLTKKQFNAVFNNGTIFHSDLFTICVVFGEIIPKASVVVSKKISQPAVVRNTLRRKIFASINECFQEKKITNGAYIFFLRRKKLPSHKDLVEIIKQNIFYIIKNN
jgi:ribonuclease P protein component